MKSFFLLLAAAVFSTVGNLLLKLSKTYYLNFLPVWINEMRPLFFLAVFCYLLNLVLFAKALETSQVSTSYPILASMGFVMLAVSSSIFLKESMTVIQLVGLLTVITGIFLLAGFKS